ncbi:MAG: HAD family hydrolase [Bacteroidaceae bacterium]
MKKEMPMPTAALFDFDGVVADTETQYSRFWEEQGRTYHPELEGFAEHIKGTTLRQIFDTYFDGMEHARQTIRQKLTDFERSMPFDYIPGLTQFVERLRERGVRTAIVTSSDRIKMEAARKAMPELERLFDRILTAEDFERSKPDPDCYVKAARALGAPTERCLVFEDSKAGLQAGRAAGTTVVGLATTLPPDVVAPMADLVAEDFRQLDVDALLKRIV